MCSLRKSLSCTAFGNSRCRLTTAPTSFARTAMAARCSRKPSPTPTSPCRKSACTSPATSSCYRTNIDARFARLGFSPGGLFRRCFFSRRPTATHVRRRHIHGIVTEHHFYQCWVFCVPVVAFLWILKPLILLHSTSYKSERRCVNSSIGKVN